MTPQPWHIERAPRSNRRVPATVFVLRPVSNHHPANATTFDQATKCSFSARIFSAALGAWVGAVPFPATGRSSSGRTRRTYGQRVDARDAMDPVDGFVRQRQEHLVADPLESFSVKQWSWNCLTMYSQVSHLRASIPSRCRIPIVLPPIGTTGVQPWAPRPHRGPRPANRRPGQVFQRSR